MVATVAAIVVLGQVQLGNWGSGTHGQHHLGVLWWGSITAVAVLAGVQQSGASGLDGPTGTAIAALVAAIVATMVAAGDVSAIAAAADEVSNVSVSTAVFVVAALVARVEEDRTQLLAAAITGTGNNLYGTLVIATGSSGARCSSSAAVSTLAIAGDAAVVTVAGAAVLASVVAAADGEADADEYRKSLCVLEIDA